MSKTTAGCDGKRKFLTFTQAKGAARNAQRHNKEPMRPYMCRECHKFHIGNVPPGEPKHLQRGR